MTSPGTWRKLAAWMLMGRPLFLIGGLLQHLLGVAVALVDGIPIDWSLALFTQLIITAAQLMTHYCNEYFDLTADLANPTPTRWAGGSRVLPDRLLPPRAALWTGLLFGAVSLAAGLAMVLLLNVNPNALLMQLFGLGIALGYSAPPLQLHSRGLGELAVGLLVGVLTPAFAYFVHAGSIGLSPFLVSLPLLFLQVAMMLALEIPDAAGDAAAGKRTLVVRLGLANSVRLHNVSLLVAYPIALLWALSGRPLLVAVFTWLSAPVAAWQAWRLRRGAHAEPALWNSVGFWAIGLSVATALAQIAALLLLLGTRSR